MNSNARLYVEGASRSADAVAKVYEKLENVPAWAAQAASGEERPVSDPLGLRSKKKKAPIEPFSEGKEAAVRLTKFVALCASELELEPEDTIFAVELTALNTINAKDCPLSAVRIDQIRESAFKYYQGSIGKIPDPR